MSRYVQLDNWIFEIKSVRAIRVDSYGKPYSAIANFNLNGSNAYIDGLMTREQDDFSRDDYQTFRRFCQQLGIQKVQFDRFKNDRLRQDTVTIGQQEAQPPRLKLVL